MDLSRIKQIDEKIDKTHQQLGSESIVTIDFQDFYNDVKYLVLMALNAQKEANKLRTKIGRMKIIIKRKDHVIRTIDHHNNRLNNDNVSKRSALEKFRDENKQLRKALGYYANTIHYDPYFFVGEACDVTEDGGYIAREALQKNRELVSTPE